MLRRALLALSLLTLAACEAAPTGPSVTLSLSQTSLTLGRNASATIAATLGSADTAQSAQWSSSNPAVATVTGGVVQAVGLGQATITASYRSRSATAQVTVRRNTAIGGVVAMRTVDGSRPFGAVTVLVGERVLGSLGGSDHGGVARKEARFGWIASSSGRAQSHVNPGPLSLTLRVTFDWVLNSPHPVVTEELSYLEIFDTDTGEILDRVSLAGREATVLRTQSIPVSLDIKIYTQ